MNRAALLVTLSLPLFTACGTRNPADAPVSPPNKVMDFSSLYAGNCSGCHGPDGKGGAAIGLGDPVYLAVADDAVIRRVTAEGVTGTSMPAFARHSGGMLTGDQIDVIVHGIRTRWAKPDVLHGVNPPSYGVTSSGDPMRGSGVYATYCASCHGPDGRGINTGRGTDGNGGKRAGSIVDGSYLALASDQNLRTTVIVGRREWGAPDWRGDVPGKPMSTDEISDVVAWLIAQRQQFPGQPYYSAMQTEGGVR
jgi:mono/diheme cytochrome c family protein